MDVRACGGKVKGVKTPIGILPAEGELDLKGLESWPQDRIAELLKVDVEAWKNEIPSVEQFFAQFGSRLPERLKKQLAALKARLG